MEIIPGLTLNISFIVEMMIKLAMLLLLVLSLVVVRQESMMDKVVNFPVGGSLKILAWLYCGLTLLFTVIVIIA